MESTIRKNRSVPSMSVRCAAVVWLAWKVSRLPLDGSPYQLSYRLLIRILNGSAMRMYHFSSVDRHAYLNLRAECPHACTRRCDVHKHQVTLLSSLFTRFLSPSLRLAWELVGTNTWVVEDFLLWWCCYFYQWPHSNVLEWRAHTRRFFLCEEVSSVPRPHKC